MHTLSNERLTLTTLCAVLRSAESGEGFVVDLSVCNARIAHAPPSTYLHTYIVTWCTKSLSYLSGDWLIGTHTSACVFLLRLQVCSTHT